MTNQEMIQKLMLGTENTETVTINYKDTEVDFTIRPLTSGELTKLQSIEKKGFQVKVGMQNGKRQNVSTNMNDIDVDVAEFTEAQAETMYTAIGWSLEVPIDDVKQLPTGLPELIFEKIIDISNLSDDDLTSVKSFHKNK